MVIVFIVFIVGVILSLINLCGYVYRVERDFKELDKINKNF